MEKTEAVSRVLHMISNEENECKREALKTLVNECIGSSSENASICAFRIEDLRVVMNAGNNYLLVKGAIPCGRFTSGASLFGTNLAANNGRGILIFLT